MRKGRFSVFLALAVFVVTAAAGIIMNGVVGKIFIPGRAWLLGGSISWYVGSSVLATILFLIGNIIVGWLLGRYMWRLGERLRMPRLYYIFTFWIVAALIGLSFCPLNIGTSAGHGIVVIFHKLFSRSMFVAMAMIAWMYAGNKYANRAFRILSGIFVAYAVFWIGLYVLGVKWLLSGLLIWESVYIVFFMADIGMARVEGKVK